MCPSHPKEWHPLCTSFLVQNHMRMTDQIRSYIENFLNCHTNQRPLDKLNKIDCERTCQKGYKRGPCYREPELLHYAPRASLCKGPFLLAPTISLLEVLRDCWWFLLIFKKGNWGQKSSFQLLCSVLIHNCEGICSVRRREINEITQSM